jgi:hypothetical protein
VTPEELAAIKRRSVSARLLRGMTMAHYMAACDDRDALIARVEELEAERSVLHDIAFATSGEGQMADALTLLAEVRRVLGGES